MERQQLHEIGVLAMKAQTAGVRWEMDPDEAEEFETTGALYNTVMRRVLDAFEERGITFVMSSDLRELRDRPANFRMKRLDLGDPADVFDTGPFDPSRRRTLELTWDYHGYRHRVVAEEPQVYIETLASAS